MDEDDKKCMLLMDEMSLMDGLKYNQTLDKVIGVVDYGEEDRTEVWAKSVTVFMLRGIRKNWKQAVGYVFTNTAISPNKLKDLLEDFVEKIGDCGLELVGITSDQGSTFVKTLKNLGCTPHKPVVTIKATELVVIPDVPHLIKSTRNILHNKYVIKTPEGTVSWNTIKSCYELNQDKDFQMIPKVTQDHIWLPKFGGKMKVKLATQVLSRTMSAAIGTLIETKLLPSSAKATEVFCFKLDQLFDIMNSSDWNHWNVMKKPLTLNSPALILLDSLKEWIRSWKIIRMDGKDVTNTFKCIDGWCQAIEAVLILFKKVTNADNFPALFTRRLCQDPLENFFAVIRQAGGGSSRPNCFQFTNSFRKIYCQDILTPPDSSNCEDDNEQALLSAFTASKDDNGVELSDIDQIEDDVPLAANASVSIDKTSLKYPVPSLKKVDRSVVARNSMQYVAGYLAKRMRSKHPNCAVCQAKSQLSCLKSKSTCFIEKKNCEEAVLGETGLTVASATFVKQCDSSSIIFNQIFHSNFHKNNIGEIIRNELKQVHDHDFCSEQMKMFFISIFLKLRIHSTIKIWNLKRKSNTGKTNDKIKKLLHV